nr:MULTISPECIES: ATP-binding protein [unclassified Herbaspirillum]
MSVYVILLSRHLASSDNPEVPLSTAQDPEEQLRVAHSQFLSTISHEIRTPMHAIIGMTDLLRVTPLDAQQEGYTKAIDDASRTLMDMIDDMLDFSKIEAGDLTLEWRDAQLLAVVEESAELVASRARSKGLRLASYVDPRLPAQLRCVPDRVRQILLHLLDNAIKFTESGAISVNARMTEWHTDHCLVRFEVRDTGIGIDSEAQSKIFKPFSQVDGSAVRNYGGVGLGLTICKQLVELMGGTIGVGSRKQVGSVFWFELPMSVGAAHATAVRSTFPRSEELALSGELTLIAPVDDVARSLSDYAQAFGLNVRRATTLSAGLEMLHWHMSNNILVIDTAVSDFSVQLLRDAHIQNRFSACLVLVANEDEHDDLPTLPGLPVLVQPLTRSTWYGALVSAISAQAEATSAIIPAAARSSSQGALVLLVEDNLLNQKVAVHQLHQLGYAVDVAMNGREALNALESNHYAAVLMDCQMPVMDGLETTRLIRLKEQDGGGHIPIIAMTANAMAGDRERCLSAGMDDYLSKPIQRNQLGVALSYHLGATTDTLTTKPSSSSTPAEDDILDMQRLSDLFDDDKQSMMAMLDLFIVHTEPMLKELQQAVLQEDKEQIAAQLHRLYGACSNLGAGQMTSLVQQASTAVNHNALVSLQHLCQDLSVAFTRLREQTEKIREAT